MTEVSSIMAKICNINFWIENDPTPFGTFPKIHPFWMYQASLRAGHAVADICANPFATKVCVFCKLSRHNCAFIVIFALQLAVATHEQFKELNLQHSIEVFIYFGKPKTRRGVTPI